MLKPFLMAVGIYLCILGGECLILDRAILAREAPAAQPQFGIFPAQPMIKKAEITPSEWAPWSLLSVGAVVILYGVSMSRQ